MGSCWQERLVGDFVQVGGAGEDTGGFVAPPLVVAALVEFGFDHFEGLQEELAGVGKGESILAGDASGELVDEELAEGDVDGGGGLEVADGGEDVGGDGVAVGDAAQLLGQVVMAEGGVAGIDGIGAAFTVGAKMGAAVRLLGVIGFG